MFTNSPTNCEMSPCIVWNQAVINTGRGSTQIRDACLAYTIMSCTSNVGWRGPYTVQKPLFWATYSAQNGVKISHLIENFTLKSMQWSELKSSNYSFFYSSLRIVTNCMHETSLSRIFLLVYPVSGLSQSRLPLIRASWISISNWNRGRTAAPPNRQVNRRGGLTRPIVNQWARLAMSLNLQFSGNAMRNVGEKDDFEALRMMGMEWNLVTW